MEFLQDFHESKFLFVRRGAAEVPGLEQANLFLDHSDPSPPYVRLFRDGPVLDSEYLEAYDDAGMIRRRIMKDRLYDLLNGGATMVLNRIDIRSRPLRQMCDEAARLTGNCTTANAYLAVSGSGSFGKHWDTHDVFAVQLAGRKRWRIYEPTWELPLRHQTSLPHKNECPEVPVFDEVLEKGDVLYVPRGWWHSADPIGELTFHVAIGVHATPLLDYVLWACQKMLPAKIEARQSLRWDDSRKSQSEAVAMLCVLRDVVGSDSSWQEFRHLTQSRQRSSLPFSIGDHVPASPTMVDLDVPLRLNTPYQDPACVNGFHIVCDGWGHDIFKSLNSYRSVTPRSILQMIPSAENETGLSILADLLRREIIERDQS